MRTGGNVQYPKALALPTLHPSDTYRNHLMQGLLGLQQQQRQLLA